MMDDYSHIFSNYKYVSTTEARLKLLELMFGGAVWGVVASNQISRVSGPFSYFLWATLTCWVVTLVSYLLQLMKRPVQRLNNQHNRNISDLPRTNDLVLNAFFVLIYLIGLILFAVYALAKNQWETTSAIMVVVMGFITLMIHMAHAATLITQLMMGKVRWSKEKQWIWKGLGKKKETRRNNYTASPANVETPSHIPSSAKLNVAHDRRSGGSNISIGSPISQSSSHTALPTVSNGDKTTDVIYEDVPIEKGGETQYYNYNQNSSNTNTQPKGKSGPVRKEEDSAYLNPVFNNSTAQ